MVLGKALNIKDNLCQSSVKFTIKKDSAGNDDTASIIKGGGYLQRVYKGFTKGVTGSHICLADRHCWISQRKVNVRFYKKNWSQPVPYCSLRKVISKR